MLTDWDPSPAAAADFDPTIVGLCSQVQLRIGSPAADLAG